jgi:hypothetical protein
MANRWLCSNNIFGWSWITLSNLVSFLCRNTLFCIKQCSLLHYPFLKSVGKYLLFFRRVDKIWFESYILFYSKLMWIAYIIGKMRWPITDCSSSIFGWSWITLSNLVSFLCRNTLFSIKKLAYFIIHFWSWLAHKWFFSVELTKFDLNHILCFIQNW